MHPTNTKKWLTVALFTTTLGLATTAHAIGSLGDSLKSRAADALGGTSSSSSSLGALALPGLSADTAGNAAGVLEYCLKQKYLSGANVDNVKGKLMDKAGLSTQKEPDPEYEQGLSGVLMGKGGQNLNLDKLQDNLKSKACDYVLESSVGL